MCAGFLRICLAPSLSPSLWLSFSTLGLCGHIMAMLKNGWLKVLMSCCCCSAFGKWLWLEAGIPLAGFPFLLLLPGRLEIRPQVQGCVCVWQAKVLAGCKRNASSRLHPRNFNAQQKLFPSGFCSKRIGISTMDWRLMQVAIYIKSISQSKYLNKKC